MGVDYSVVDRSRLNQQLLCDVCNKQFDKLVVVESPYEYVKWHENASIAICSECLAKMKEALWKHEIPTPYEQALKLYKQSIESAKLAKEKLKDTTDFCDGCKKELIDHKANFLNGKILCTACALEELK